MDVCEGVLLAQDTGPLMVLGEVGATRLHGRTPGDTSIRGSMLSQPQYPIQDATTELVRRSDGALQAATTDVIGRYQLERLEPGTYDVKISAPGFVVHRGAPIVLARDHARFEATTLFPWIK